MAATVSPLERLHPELVDLVVAELVSVTDISALRLTCRTLATRVVQSPAMRPYIARKTVELTTRDLETFVAITGPDYVVGHQLRHLTLKGIARNKTAVYMSKYSDLAPPTHADEDPEQDQDTLLRNAPEEDPEEHKRLLVAALTNLKNHGRLGALASLTLTIGPSTKPRAVYIVPRHKRGAGTFPEEVDAGIGGGSVVDPYFDTDNEDNYVAPYELPYRPSWRSVWDAAERTFGVAIHALMATHLPVTDEMDVFQSVVACALPFDAFLALTREPSLVPVFSSLKRLKVHLSLRHRSAADERKAAALEEARQEREAEADGTNEVLTISRLQAEFENAHRAQLSAEWRAAHRVLQAITAPAELTHVMPALETVNVDWYQVGRNMVPPAEVELPSPPSYTAPSTTNDTHPLPHLHSLSLHGMRLDGSDFLRFLDTVRPEHLSLRYPQFTPGSFEPVLRYLTDPDLRDPSIANAIPDLDARLVSLRPSPVRRFELDDVMDGYVLVHYAVPGRPKFRYLDLPNLGPCTLVRPDTSLDTTAPLTQAAATAVTAAAASNSPDPPEASDRPVAPGTPPVAPVTTTPADDPPGGVQMIYPHTRPMGSGSRWRWARHNGSIYGPPRARYDLPLLNPGMVPNPLPLKRLAAEMHAAAEMSDRLERREAASGRIP